MYTKYRCGIIVGRHFESLYYINIELKMINMRYLLIIIFFCLLSCHPEKDEVIDPTTKTSFHANINGTEISIIENENIQNIDSVVIWDPSIEQRFGAIDKVIYTFGLYLGGFITIDKMPANSISIDFVNHFSNSQINSDGSISSSLFNEIFSKGDKTYSNNILEQPGILIEWYDANRHKWTTNHYLNTSSLIPIPVKPNLANSTFTIVKSISMDPISSNYKSSQYLEISFNCNLYDINGDSIKMTNANFKGIYSIFQHN